MPRIRYLKPDFFKDEDLATLPYEYRLLFAGLWGLADKAGRLEDRPERIKAELFPYDNVDVSKGLVRLSQSKNGSHTPFIHRYLTDRQRYIQIVNWNKHQKPHHTEKESEIPPAPPLTDNGETRTDNGKAARSESDVKEPLPNGAITVKREKPAILEEFEAFWQKLPHKVGKGEARKAYITARKQTSKEEIHAGLVKYQTYENMRKQRDLTGFRPLHPATWLNQERWADEVQEKATDGLPEKTRLQEIHEICEEGRKRDERQRN